MPLNTTGKNAILTSGAGGATHVGALTALTPTEVTGWFWGFREMI